MVGTEPSTKAQRIMIPNTDSSWGQKLVLRNGAGLFHLGKLVARTNNSTIYRALYFPDSGRAQGIKQVVLKITPPNSPSQQRLFNEAAVLSNHQHPAYPKYVNNGVGQLSGSMTNVAYLAMELIQGPTLLEVLKTRKPSLPESLGRVIALCSALEPLHKRNLIYRDWSPGNVIVDNFGTTRLIDFGSLFDVQTQRDAATQESITQEQTIATTGLYAAPEQFQAQPLSINTDIYSLGLMLHILLTNSNPMAGKNPMATLIKHVSRPMPSLTRDQVTARLPMDKVLRFGAKIDQLQLTLNTVIQQATAKRPEDRQRNVGRLQQVLTRIQAQLQ